MKRWRLAFIFPWPSFGPHWPSSFLIHQSTDLPSCLPKLNIAKLWTMIIRTPLLALRLLVLWTNGEIYPKKFPYCLLVAIMD
jgi:hypothetical protein